LTSGSVSIVVMMWLSGPISDFVDRHPTVKMLALSFLLLIGTTLIADSCGAHIPKGYIYAAMGFSVFVEALNMVHRRRAKPVHLRQSYSDTAPAANGNGHGG
jgi:predicted tellurium resistance membrane protein TerC